MGQAKREWEKQQELEGSAADAAMRSGALRPCLMHSDILINSGDDEATRKAYAIATNMLKVGDVAGERSDLMDAVKAVIEEAPEECPRCAGLADD